MALTSLWLNFILDMHTLRPHLQGVHTTISSDVKLEFRRVLHWVREQGIADVDVPGEHDTQHNEPHDADNRCSGRLTPGEWSHYGCCSSRDGTSDPQRQTYSQCKILSDKATPQDSTTLSLHATPEVVTQEVSVWGVLVGTVQLYHRLLHVLSGPLDAFVR